MLRTYFSVWRRLFCEEMSFCFPPNGKQAWRLHLPTENVGSFGSFGVFRDSLRVRSVCVQPSQSVGRLGGVLQYRRWSASLKFISERGQFHWRSLMEFAASTHLFLGLWAWCVWLLLVLDLWCAWDGNFLILDCSFWCCHGLGMLFCFNLRTDGLPEKSKESARAMV